MKILRVQFSAYNKKRNHYAQCFILIQETSFSITSIYKISSNHDYTICSKIHIDLLIEHLCKAENGDFWQKYQVATAEGFSFTEFSDKGNISMDSFKVPRFQEGDFEHVINTLGGNKIQELNSKTPDFIFDDILLELKDLQEESLNNPKRQNSIAELFKDSSEYSINIDPSQNHGELTNRYHRIIKNGIKNQFKSASKQIKEHAKKLSIKGAGIIILNTGLYSLPHQLFKEMVSDILKRETKTIEFAFVFSQKMQTNGWDLYAVFASEWVGPVPENIKILKSEFDKLVDKKMTNMMHKKNSVNTSYNQTPISFEINNKVFFWNPGQITFPWDKA